MRQPKCHRLHKWQARWEQLAQDIRAVMGDNGEPLAVWHHTGHEHKLWKQQNKTMTLFQHFNTQCSNQQWKLVEANVAPGTVIGLDGPEDQSTECALVEADGLPCAQISKQNKQKNAEWDRLESMLPYPLCVQQQFTSRCELVHGFCALFEPGGPCSYCFDCRPHRWCRLGPNSVLVHSVADGADRGNKYTQQEDMFKCSKAAWQLADEHGMSALYQQMQQDVLQQMHVLPDEPLFVFHHSQREHLLLAMDGKDTGFQRFNRKHRNKAWPLVQASVGPSHTVDLAANLESSQKPSAQQHALARSVLDCRGEQPVYVVQRVSECTFLHGACSAMFLQGQELADSYYSFGPYEWYQIGPNAILVLHISTTLLL